MKTKTRVFEAKKSGKVFVGFMNAEGDYELMDVKTNKTKTITTKTLLRNYRVVKEQEKTPEIPTTGQKITTPRGTFSETSYNREQMEALGYGVHHNSEDGTHLIMGNGTRAFAVRKNTTVTVDIVAFTGMKIGTFTAHLDSETGHYIVHTKQNKELIFDIHTGLQLNAKNPKFGNRVVM